MSSKHSILIIEDEAFILDIMKRVLEKRGYDVRGAASYNAALKQLKKHSFDLVLLDLTLPDGSGLQLLDKMAEEYRNRVIIVSGTGTIDIAVEAMRKGAFDFLRKPVDHNVLLISVKRAIDLNRKLDDYHQLKDNLDEPRIDRIVYKSALMADVVAKAKECAGTHKTILITGETGTGKELLAHAIHNASERRGNPFVTVNCATIPINLAESELFGFEKGAFTGAEKPYPGKFCLADKGTILLDEIGELHPEIQPKLLRVLESGEIFSLNSTKPKRLDIRIVAATNRNVKDPGDDISFRSDLYYRIQQFEIHIPPLRRRKEDILPLVENFIKGANATYSREVKKIDKEVEKLLVGYRWPGNVRELKNTIEEIMTFISGDTIKVEHLPTRLLKYQDPVYAEKHVLSLKDVEREHIKEVLKLTGFNIRKTSQLLGIGRPALYRKIELYKLRQN